MKPPWLPLRRSTDLGGLSDCRFAAAVMFLAGLAIPAWPADAPRFAEVAGQLGVNFRHVSPQSEQRHVHLTMGSGVAWIDFDRDGTSDLYFAQGTPWTGTLEPVRGPSDRLFSQQQGRFRDVTENAGLHNAAYGMGIAVGDFNNDGFPDLYVSNFGPNRFFVNNGDGTFTEQAATRGLDDAGYGASCTWFDADSDGWLDLFVTNYLEVDVAHYKTCIDRSAEGTGLPIACPPWELPPQPDLFFRNLGNGQFEDASASSGLRGAAAAQGLGVVAADLDSDGDQDLYVANDSVPNHQWMNDGRGGFTEMALVSGTALNKAGQREAGMGIAVGDGDGDGQIDLFVTNFHEETNTFYRSEGLGLFSDVTDSLGLGAPSRSRLGFGTNFLDAENDGDLDVFVANGHIHDRLRALGRDVPYRQPAQLMVFQGGRFRDASAEAGECFSRPALGRGSATADFNRDGLIDIAVNNLDGAASLLKNVSQSRQRSLLVELIGTKSPRDGTGASLHVELDGRKLVRLREGSSSYLSCSDSVVHVGIGSQDAVDSLQVRWPSGTREVWRNVPAGTVTQLVEGTGDPVP